MKRKKKYNPLKKYQKGGSTTAAIQTGVASAEKEDQPENLMLGRTYIPRMSEATRDEIIAAGRKAVEKIRDKRAAKKLKKEEEEVGMTEDVSKKDMRKEKREEKRFMREADRFFAKTKREEKRKSKKRPKNVRGLLRSLKKLPVRDDVFMPTANITTKKAKR